MHLSARFCIVVLFISQVACASTQSYSQPNSRTLPVVDSVDIQRYQGKWYEIAAIPQWFQKQCVGNTTAEYELLEGGLVKVINGCDKANGDRSVSEGRARIVDTATNAKLLVTFVNFFGWKFSFGGDYWIIDLGNNYEYAVVGHPTLKYAWLLSRTPNVGMELLTSIERKLTNLGYDTCKIKMTRQKGGSGSDTSLCNIVKE